jgi:hypothetical protein
MKLQKKSVSIGLGIALAVGVSLFAKSQSGSRQGCDPKQTDVSSYTSLKRGAGEDGSRLVNVEQRITGAAQPVAYRYFAFAGDQQIGADDPPLTIPCGESRSRTYTLPKDENSFSVYFQEEPIVPPEMIDRKPETLPQWWLSQQVFDWGNTESVVFGAAAPFNKSTSDIPTRFVTTERKKGYLFTGSDHLKQGFAEQVTQPKFDFNVFFSQTDDTNKSGIYTITCMLNHKQINAFNGHVAWSGRIPPGKAVILKGHVEIASPGWQRLRCVPLANIYAAEDQESPFPYTIDSLFVYRAP